MGNDGAVAVLVILGIGVAALLAFALRRPAPQLAQARELAQPVSGGWHNEETIDVERNEEGLAVRYIVHRKVSPD